MQSYLNNRLQHLYINNIESNRRSVILGVPRLFADDTFLLFNASSICELEIKINKELSRVSQWMSKNRLTINPSKSQAIIIPPLLPQVVLPSNINIKLISTAVQLQFQTVSII